MNATFCQDIDIVRMRQFTEKFRSIYLENKFLQLLSPCLFFAGVVLLPKVALEILLSLEHFCFLHLSTPHFSKLSGSRQRYLSNETFFSIKSLLQNSVFCTYS